jgi:hypothetical protein
MHSNTAAQQHSNGLPVVVNKVWDTPHALTLQDCSTFAGF